MKNFFKKIGNFFKKIWNFICKYCKIAWNYIAENAWLQPILIVALIFVLVFGLVGVVEGVEKIKASNEEKRLAAKDQFKKLTMDQVREKLKDGEDFALFIGAHDCVYCNDFKSVVNKYISSTGKMIYYIDIHDTSDSSISPSLHRDQEHVFPLFQTVS